MKVAAAPVAERCRRDPATGCLLYAGALNSDGYGSVRRKTRGGWSSVGAHRVAWEEAFGPIPAGLSVLHRCDTRACCEPDHLFLGTQKDNMADCARKGRYRCKLTPHQAREIRRLRGRERQRDTAARYGVSQRLVGLIQRGEAWAWV